MDVFGLDKLQDIFYFSISVPQYICRTISVSPGRGTQNPEWGSKRQHKCSYAASFHNPFKMYLSVMIKFPKQIPNASCSKYIDMQRCISYGTLTRFLWFTVNSVSLGAPIYTFISNNFTGRVTIIYSVFKNLFIVKNHSSNQLFTRLCARTTHLPVPISLHDQMAGTPFANHG